MAEPYEMENFTSDEHPLRGLVVAWRKKIRLALEYKEDEFGKYADEGMKFFLGGKEVWEYMTGKRGVTDVVDDEESFKFVLAKVAELVQLYGPVLYHRNPIRSVRKRELPSVPEDLIVPPELQQRVQQLEQAVQQEQEQGIQNPQTTMAFQQARAEFDAAMQMLQQMNSAQSGAERIAAIRAELMRSLLNYTPGETDLKWNSRKGIDESLIKGMGVLVTETYQPHTGSHTLVGSFYETVDNWVVDPDAETIEFPDCRWVGRRRTLPVRKVAEMYGEDEEFLRKHAQIVSCSHQAEGDVYDPKDENSTHARGKSNDVMVLWHVYSRMGFGDKLTGVPKSLRRALRGFGDNLYLCIAPGIPYFLNLKSEAFLEAFDTDEEDSEQLTEMRDEAFMAVQWPIPFWMDNEWPFTELAFHEIPNCPWPMSHIRPALPELKFLNFGYSWLANRAKHTSRLFLGLLEDQDDELKEAAAKGGPFTTLGLKRSHGVEDVGKAVQFVGPPQGGVADLTQAVIMTGENFDKRSGLSEVMYAMPGGMRSATEAQIKNEARNIRPDDMANLVEDWMSRVARKEALAMQWLLDAEDVAPVLGPAGAMLWEQYIANADLAEIVFEFDYRVEAGSARKPNRDTEIYQANQALQVLAPVYAPLVQAGIVGPWNAVVEMWAKANDIEDVEKFLIPPPPPDQGPSPEEQQLAMEQAKAEMDAQVEQAKLELQARSEAASMQRDEAEHDQEMRQRAEEHAQDMRFGEQQQELKLAGMKVANAMKRQAAKPSRKE